MSWLMTKGRSFRVRFCGLNSFAYARRVISARTK